MPSYRLILSLVVLLLLATACADDNDNAPSVDQPHLMGAAWLLPSEHPTAAIDNSPPCFQCHQEEGGPISPACRDCHRAAPPNFVLGSCDSCHGKPPSGSARPNRAGAHGLHNALDQVTGICNTCHDGYGSGSLHHYDTKTPADVAFLPVYSAKTGPAEFTADPSNPSTGTCASVSCHGGQQTPDWLTGRLNVNQQCTACHQVGTAFQTPQYNSPYSGQHVFHVETFGFACIICHDTTKLQTGHFIGLNTSVFEGDPGATIQDFINYDEQNMTCSTNNAACHPGQTRMWQ